eukprot:XP_025014197.1 glutamate receptor 2.5-like [Ricinus communis]
MCALALAMEEIPYQKGLQNSTDSSRIASEILAPAHIFRLINVVGKSYRELGYWTENLGFSENIGIRGKYNKSMRILGQVFWPGGPWSVPRGWAAPTSTEPLKIGVPMGNQYKEFIHVKHDNRKGMTVTGFSVDIFKSALSFLPYTLPHNFVPFKGTYDSSVEQIKLRIVDAVVADTAIVANRCQFAEFTQPYADPGLQVLVQYNNQFAQGTIWEQIGRMLSTAFITIFSLKGDKLHSNLSRTAMVAWLFVVIVITQSFIPNLTTLLTVQRLDPVMVDVGTLKESRAKVGCDGNSFVVKYLEHVLGFDAENIVRIYSGDQNAQVLASGEINAAFLEVPCVKIFLAKNCRRLASSGPTFKVGGFGFVGVSKEFSISSDISEAILSVAESGN